MKKIALSLLFLAIGLTTMVAQDASKDAKKALVKYRMDPESKVSELQVAKDKIDEAVKDDESSALYKTWSTKGDIYTEIATNPFYQTKYADAATQACDAYEKANGLAVKKFEKEGALKGLNTAAPFLTNEGVDFFEKGDYKSAYASFNKVLQIKEKLGKAGEKGLLANEADHQKHMYITGLAASNAGLNDEAIAALTPLVDAGFDEPNIYNSLFNAYQKKEEMDKAEAIISKGRKLYPENSTLLFSEINYYIATDKLSSLEGKLKEAIAQEPDNASLYFVTGNMYDKLYQDDKSQANFDNAISYYGQAAEKDPKYTDAIYSIGAMYYNKAVVYRKQMADLPISANKEYNNLDNQSKALIDKALPYFLQVDEISKSDFNTLLALKEIYAIKDDLTKSNTYKVRLAELSKGRKND